MTKCVIFFNCKRTHIYKYRHTRIVKHTVLHIEWKKVTPTPLKTFGEGFKSCWKYYTDKDLKVTLKKVLLGFNSRLYPQNIDCYILHEKLDLYQQKLISGKPEFCTFKLYTEVQNFVVKVTE